MNQANFPTKRTALVSYGSMRLCLSLILVLPIVFTSTAFGDISDTALTSDGYNHSYPQWSPDGVWITYRKVDSTGNEQIYKVSASGGGELSLTSDSYDHDNPQWSPDSAWITYEKFDATGKNQIYKVPSAGGAEVALTSDAYNHYNPQWSPDGQWIAYHKYDSTGKYQIYKVPSAGGSETALTSSNYSHRKPQWSLNGSWLVFERYSGNYYQIWKVRSTGGSETALTNHGYTHWYPEWSPDGNWVVFQHHASSGADWISKVSASGGNCVDLMPIAGDNYRPQWSPDGNWILYAKRATGGLMQVYKIPPSGGTAVELTDSAYNHANPQWSPDGNWVVYSRNDATGFTQIYTVRSDWSPGTLQFGADSYSAYEDGGNIMLTVTRTGGSYGAASVTYTTSNDTAIAGSDYTPTSGTLTWADYDCASKTITVSIIDDTMQEDDETFMVTLSNPTGAGMGSLSSTTVTIPVNDAPCMVATLAGYPRRFGSTDGTGSAARFDSPEDVAVDSQGNVHVADHDNHTIRKITSAGVVTTLAGSAGNSGNTDGTGADARFAYPSSVAVDSQGNVYVADWIYDTIRKITSAGVVSTLAGSAGSSGSADGTGADARFDRPRGVAVDSQDNVYVADEDNHTIRKITSSGVVTTLAGSAGSSGSTDGTGVVARFYEPRDVAVDSQGNVYVADRRNQTIRKVTPAGVVTTIAGSVGNSGNTDGTGADAKFSYPTGVAADSQGNVYVADCYNHTIRKVTPAGVVTTIAGSAGSSGSTDGTGTDARFYWPYGVAVDSASNVYVADEYNHTIRKITLGQRTLQFNLASCSVNEDTGSVTLTLTRSGDNSGAASVQYTTSNGTAAAGLDYTSQSGTLSWSDGDSSNKTITISITDDSTPENNETFTVTLSNASESGMGVPSSTTVEIADDDSLSITPEDVRITSISLVGNDIAVTWKATNLLNYTLTHCDDLTGPSPAWNAVAPTNRPGPSSQPWEMTGTNSGASAVPSRFYRVEANP